MHWVPHPSQRDGWVRKSLLHNKTQNQSAEGAFYTSLGQRPRSQTRERQRAEVPIYNSALLRKKALDVGFNILFAYDPDIGRRNAS